MSIKCPRCERDKNCKTRNAYIFLDEARRNKIHCKGCGYEDYLKSNTFNSSGKLFFKKHNNK